MSKLVEKEFNAHHYDLFWDDIAMFKYPEQFNLALHKIKKDDLVEIDSLEELREIDSSYCVGNLKQVI